MALIKIELLAPPVDGMDIKFKAPCDCSAITGMLVTYPEGSQEFTFRDSHGNNVAGIGNLFGEGAYVKVIVDVERGHAYLQNADNNGFLNSAILGTYIHDGDNLTGCGGNGKFKATASGTISSINVNGVSCSVKCGEESSMDLIAGCWYTFILDGDTVNFSSGGGGGIGFEESTDYPGCFYRTVDGVTEWLNPPMVLGTEYRTTERFANKVVYAKAINFGKIEEKTVSVNIVGTNVVSVYGYGYDSSGVIEYFPIISSANGAVVAYFWYEAKKISVSVFGDGVSGYTGIFVIKYTK